MSVVSRYKQTMHGRCLKLPWDINYSYFFLKYYESHCMNIRRRHVAVTHRKVSTNFPTKGLRLKRQRSACIFHVVVPSQSAAVS